MPQSGYACDGKTCSLIADVLSSQKLCTAQTSCQSGIDGICAKLNEYYKEIDLTKIHKGSFGVFMHQFALSQFPTDAVTDVPICNQNTVDNYLCAGLDDRYTPALATYTKGQKGRIMSWTFWNKGITQNSSNNNTMSRQVFADWVPEFVFFSILDTQKLEDVLVPSDLNKLSSPESLINFNSDDKCIQTNFDTFAKFWYSTDGATNGVKNYDGYNTLYGSIVKDPMTDSLEDFIENSNKVSPGTPPGPLMEFYNNEVLSNTWIISDNLKNI